ncbi:MAG: GTPase [Lachnospiraceae bacterium]|nr:GTPase [Lachnospiraceae bacterium]
MLNKKVKEIPVFVFMGFLECGKTKFCSETLIDRNFTEGDKTLLIVTEEGMEEYDEAELAKRNISVAYLDEEDINTEKLLDLQDEYEPKAVMIEYNGMWQLDRLFSIRVPKGWTVVQVITLIDATTFTIYNNNMKSLMLEHIQNADMVVFNRCTEETDINTMRMAVKTVNRRAQIVFENVNGQAQIDDGEMEIPYDMDKDVIEIEDEDYGIFYIDASDNPEKYVDRVVKFKGQVYCPPQYKGKAFVPGRFAMTCCAEDITFLGFKCVTLETSNLKDREWVTVTAKVKCEYYEEFEGDGPVLYPQKIEKADKPEEEVVYF